MQTFKATTESGAVYTITISPERKLPMAQKNGWDKPIRMLCIRIKLLEHLRASVAFREEPSAASNPYLCCYDADGKRTMRVLPKKVFKGGILADPMGAKSTRIVDLVEI